MFVAEIVAGVAANSRSLLADVLDFFGDAANYAISLVVAIMAWLAIWGGVEVFGEARRELDHE